MAKGKKTGGRKPGSFNKSTLPLQEKCESLNVDPFLVLLYFVTGDWKALGYKKATQTLYTKDGVPYEVDVISVDHRLKAASEACCYVYPKRKAVEIDASIKDMNNKTQIIQIQWADENDPTQNAPSNPATKENQSVN